MARVEKRDPIAITRPIKTKRDFDGTKTAVKRLSAAPKRDSAAELRLQALLAEMDRYEATGEDGNDDDNDFADASLYGGPRRRWVDEGSDE